MFKLNLLLIIFIFSISFGFLITPIAISSLSSEPSTFIVVETDPVIHSFDFSNQISQLQTKINDDQIVITSLENSIKMKDDEIRSLTSNLTDTTQINPSSDFRNDELENMNLELSTLKDKLATQNIIIENINTANLTVVFFF